MIFAKRQISAVKKPAAPLQKQNSEAVKVIVRCRPFVAREHQEKQVVTVDKELRQISLLKDEKPKATYKTFRFDEVFDEHSTQ